MSDLDRKIYSVNQAIRMEEVAHNKAIDKCKQILMDLEVLDKHVELFGEEEFRVRAYEKFGELIWK